MFDKKIIKRQQAGSPPARWSAWDPYRSMREMMRWDPFRELGAFAGWQPEEFVPHFDVKETVEGYQVSADLPGVNEKDLSVHVTGNRLTVSGKREHEEKREGEHEYATERVFGSFTRSFVLPEEVDTDKVQAELKSGVLTLMLPRRPGQQRKKVSVKVKS